MAAGDVRCPRCAEPWHLDAVHDAADWQGRTFQDVWAEFRAKGCQALEPGLRCQVNRNGHLVAALVDAFGHDPDGLASDLADAEALGLLD